MLHSYRPNSKTILSYLSPPLSSQEYSTVDTGGETFQQNPQLPLAGDNGDIASSGNEVAKKPLEDSADLGPNVSLDSQGIAAKPLEITIPYYLEQTHMRLIN